MPRVLWTFLENKNFLFMFHRIFSKNLHQESIWNDLLTDFP